MKKHNCKEWFEEARGCSICSKLLLKSPIKTIEELKEVVAHSNWIITEQKNEIAELKEKHEERLRKELDKNASAYLNRLQAQREELKKQYKDEIRKARIDELENLSFNKVNTPIRTLERIAQLKFQRKK